MSAINVLVVDDSETVRNIIIKVLGLSGVETQRIHEAGNGQEGLEVLCAESIDLVFSDINMPVMNGPEMIDRMKADEGFKGIPVVVVTTDGSLRRMADLKEKGVNAIIRKPFTPEQIRNVVQKVLRGGDDE